MDQVKKHRNRRGKANNVTEDRQPSGKLQDQKEGPPATKRQPSRRPRRRSSKAGNEKNTAPAVIAKPASKIKDITISERPGNVSTPAPTTTPADLEKTSRRRRRGRRGGRRRNKNPPTVSTAPAPTTDAVATTSTSTTPLSDHDRLWRAMTQKEIIYRHSSSLLDKHPDISPRHRAMVLLWLMEICQVKEFFKETYFTASDLFDRFLLNSQDIGLLDLQLVAISALFIADKLQQRSTLRARDYVIMADGLYTSTEIKSCQETILKVLKWKATPVTAITWGSFYLQNCLLVTSQGSEMKNKNSKLLFIHASRLLNLSMLDAESLTFKYSILAACAFYFAHPQPKTIVDILLPRLDQDEFFECLRWMVNFHDVLSDPLLPANAVELEECHLVQRLTINLQMLNKALGMPKFT